MSAPVKQAPVKAAATVPTATARKPRTTLPPVDFSEVSISDGGVIKQDRRSMLDGTPVRGWVKASRDADNTVKTVQVKTVAVDTVKALIQRAAQELGCGVKFGQVMALSDPAGYSAVPFATKDRAAKKVAAPVPSAPVVK